MKFIADHMLGRLATWMQMIGCDVAYDSLLEDKGLIEQAEREERIILTRDTHLIKRKKVRNISFFIQGDSYKDQLFQVIQRFEIDPYKNFLTRSEPVSKVLLQEIIDIAHSYPSYRNCQPWEVVVVPGKKKEGPISPSDWFGESIPFLVEIKKRSLLFVMQPFWFSSLLSVESDSQ